MAMDKKTYFKLAMEAGCYRYKRWVVEAFSIVMSAQRAPEYRYALVRDPKRGYGFVSPTGNPEGTPNADEIILLTDTDPNQPLFAFLEPVKLKAGEVANLKQDVTTTYGNWLVNQMALVHAFGDRVDFVTGHFDIGKIQKQIAKRLQDDPEEGAERDPKALYVSEFCLFNEAILSLGGYNSLCVTSATEKTMTADPRIKEVRAELLEKYKDRLHDPVIQSKIEEELKKIDREWLRGDPAEKFFIRDKSYNVVRKKTFLMQGAAEGFGEEAAFIPTSLADGWDIRHLPAMANSLRDGTYNRGTQTALGGEVTKFNYRVFQNTSISEEDCGSKLGLEIVLTSDLARHVSGHFLLGPQGRLIELTDANIESYIGKRISLRYPTYCNTSGANFCATCSGKNLAATPNAISTYISDIGSTFLNLFLKKMHGSALKVVRMDLDSVLS